MKAFRSGLFAAALLGTSALVAPSAALAETPAPKFTTIDQNNVDLSTGLVWYGMEEGGIGSRARFDAAHLGRGCRLGR